MPLSTRHRRTAAVMALAPVIPVLTVTSVDDGVAQAHALVAGGLCAIEVTLRTAGALAAIRAIGDAVPDAVVGAGTIVSLGQIDEAVTAGARFLVSPGAPRRSRRPRRRRRFRSCPACHRVRGDDAEGARLPRAQAVPRRGRRRRELLASLAAPLPDLRFCPTGGIDLAKAPAYLGLPNVVCVGGSWMLPKAAIAAGDYFAVEAQSREAAGLKRAAA